MTPASEHGSEPVEIDYDSHERLSDSGLANLFVILGEEYWIPASQMSQWDPNNSTFVIPEWLAYDEGLI